MISHDSFKPEKSFWSVCSTPVRDEIFIARSVLCRIDGWTKKTTSHNQLFLDGQHVLHIKFIHNLGLGGISLHLAVPMNGQRGLVRQSSPPNLLKYQVKYPAAKNNYCGIFLL